MVALILGDQHLLPFSIGLTTTTTTTTTPKTSNATDFDTPSAMLCFRSLIGCLWRVESSKALNHMTPDCISPMSQAHSLLRSGENGALNSPDRKLRLKAPFSPDRKLGLYVP